MLSDTFTGLAAWHGLKALVAGAVVVTFLATVSAPAQRARHQAEASTAAKVAHCLATRPATPDALGRFLDRANCKARPAWWPDAQ
jgi:hypothetical protein